LRQHRWLVFAPLGLGLAVSVPGARDGAPQEPAAATAPNPLDAALEERIQGKAGLEDVEIAASWQLAQGSASARVWGTGLGIWRERTQFRLSRQEVVSLLKLLSAAKVGAMRQPDPKTPAPTPANAPLRLTGELTVVAGSAQRSLQQLAKGEQSGELRSLVESILAVCEKVAKTGVGASSLEDGLAKLSKGTLAPETFEAIVRRGGEAKAGGSAESWLFRMNGRRVTDRLMPKGELPPPPRELTISEADFQRIVRLLRDNDPTRLPKNVYAPAYTDVTVEILDQDRTIPARPYLGVTAQTHGVEQQKFERIYEAFRALHQRVQAEGKAAADPAKPALTPSSPAAP
jgi:hypothetical protein